MRKTLTVIIILIACSCGAQEVQERTTDFKAVVLGFDGVDPDLVRLWLDRLPNLQQLADSGSLTELGTTNPPESPVAWASFATGTNPGKHGIFDFLRRDPETYFPDIGLVQIEKPKFLFGFLPIRRAKITNNRQGLTFWKHLDASGISTTNLRMPLEFPPASLDRGTIWSGLSVPDIRGTWGTYFYLATDLTQWDLKDTEFGGRLIRLEEEDNVYRADLDGPVDPRSDNFERLVVPVELALNSESTAVTIRMQDQEETIAEGEWSDWFRFQFSIGPLINVNGVSRFYVLETFPELRVYLMPISLSPSEPPFAISSPSDYTVSLAEDFGYFKTLGWIHETWGLNEEQIDEKIFLEDLFRNMDNLEQTLLKEMDEDRSSLYTAVFTATDSVSHMFYRLLDPQHPRFDQSLADQYGDSILRVYEKMDSIIGRVLERLGTNDHLFVVSDHGFHTWRKEFNTNTWLARNGFMTLTGSGDGDEEKRLGDMFSGGSFFPNVDWSKTQAYAVGLGHIYINLKGREAQGIIEPGEEYQAVIEDIQGKIAQFLDPDSGEKVIQNSYFRDDIYTGDQLEHAGDIQVTFSSGYRTSWQTALGAVPPDIVVANLKKWSGDHCASDFSDTAGFLASNRKITSPAPNLIDVAPTVYKTFGVMIPKEVDGKAWSWEEVGGK